MDTPRKRGPKPIFPGQVMSRHVVSLDSLSLRKLKVLGEGNLSMGVRKAADDAYDKYQESGPAEGPKDR